MNNRFIHVIFVVGILLCMCVYVCPCACTPSVDTVRVVCVFFDPSVYAVCVWVCICQSVDLKEFKMY